MLYPDMTDYIWIILTTWYVSYHHSKCEIDVLGINMHPIFGSEGQLVQIGSSQRWYCLKGSLPDQHTIHWSVACKSYLHTYIIHTTHSILLQTFKKTEANGFKKTEAKEMKSTVLTLRHQVYSNSIRLERLSEHILYSWKRISPVTLRFWKQGKCLANSSFKSKCPAWHRMDIILQVQLFITFYLFHISLSHKIPQTNSQIS